MSRWSKICLFCFSEGVPKRSLLVAIVIGTLLNLINQGDALLRGEHVDLVKVALTFGVPYCVATYGAVSYRLRIEAERVRETERDPAFKRGPTSNA